MSTKAADQSIDDRDISRHQQNVSVSVSQAGAYRYIGRACFQLSEFDDALDRLGHALELHRQLDDASGVESA